MTTNLPTKDLFNTGEFPVVGYIERDGFRAEVCYEEVIETFMSPRDMDNLGVMLCGHSRYELGDEQMDSHGIDTSVDCPSCGGSGYRAWADGEAQYLVRDGYGGKVIATFEFEEDADHFAETRCNRMEREAQEGGYELTVAEAPRVEELGCLRCEEHGTIELTLGQYLRQERGARVIIPLYLYDHSGITMSAGRSNPFSCPWDSGQVGVIFDTAESRKLLGCDHLTDAEIEAGLLEEVELYDSYLRGEVFFYIIRDPDGEVVDSCGGFLGDDPYVFDQAYDELNHAIAAKKEADAKEAAEAHYWATHEVATVA